MIKTTRIKTVQAPKTVVYDLSSQTDGTKQVFTLPVAVSTQDSHYLLFNSTVYKNDTNHTFYTISNNGLTLTTLFSDAPDHGTNKALQLVVNESGAGLNGDYVTRDEMIAAIGEAIRQITGSE